jgi:flagellar protein FlgJ
LKSIVTKAEKFAWLDDMAPAAQASQRQSGIPASIILAQAFLESADRQGNPGQSQLARQCSNYFGIKLARSERAPYAEFSTREFVNGKAQAVLGRFRAFPSVEASFQRHAQLIATEPRYAAAMDNVHDPLAFAAQLQICLPLNDLVRN